MANEPETAQKHDPEPNVLYYLIDEQDREVGFVIEEDGREVEYYYEGYDADSFTFADDESEASREPDLRDVDDASSEVVELEYSEDDILYYLVDEQDREVGFVIEEDGREVECYYEDVTSNGEEKTSSDLIAQDGAKDDVSQPGYFSKLATIATHEGGKVRIKAEGKLDQVRSKAEAQVGKAKAKAENNDLGITREGIKETTNDLNALAKEGAETAKEFKEAYDDIMDNFGFLMPKKARRRLP